MQITKSAIASGVLGLNGLGFLSSVGVRQLLAEGRRQLGRGGRVRAVATGWLGVMLIVK